MRRLGVVFAVVALALLSVLPALAQPGHATGLDRAKEVAARGVETARGLQQGPGADKATGLARAAEAVSAALARGNGNGHGWGRGHAADLLDLLANGGSPSDLAGHGQAIRDMVHAYNALRTQGS